MMRRLRRLLLLVAVLSLTAAVRSAHADTCPSGANYLPMNQANQTGGYAFQGDVWNGSVTLASLGITNCFYVSILTGNDGNSGTKAAPFAHIPGSPLCVSTCNGAAITPGTGIILRGGETWGSANFTIKLKNGSATAAHPNIITFDRTFFTGGAWARPIFDGGGTYQGVFLLSDVKSNYWVVDGIEFKGAYTSFTLNAQGQQVSTNPMYIENCAQFTIAQRNYMHGWVLDPTMTTNAAGASMQGGCGANVQGSMARYNVVNGVDTAQHSFNGILGNWPIVYGNWIQYIQSGIDGSMDTTHDNYVAHLVVPVQGAAHQDAIYIQAASGFATIASEYNNVICCNEPISGFDTGGTGLYYVYNNSSFPRSYTHGYLFNNILSDNTQVGGNAWPVLMSEHWAMNQGNWREFNNTISCGYGTTASNYSDCSDWFDQGMGESPTTGNLTSGTGTQTFTISKDMFLISGDSCVLLPNGQSEATPSAYMIGTVTSSTTGTTNVAGSCSIATSVGSYTGIWDLLPIQTRINVGDFYISTGSSTPTYTGHRTGWSQSNILVIDPATAISAGFTQTNFWQSPNGSAATVNTGTNNSAYCTEISNAGDIDAANACLKSTGGAVAMSTACNCVTGYYKTPIVRGTTWDKGAWEFAAGGVSYSISGNAGTANAAVALTGASSQNVTADASGNYSFNGLQNGSYTVTPTLSGFTFTPTSQNETVSSANITGVNFTASGPAQAPNCSPQTETFSGTVSVTCLNPNSGTTVMCYRTDGTNPATAGNGASCAAGSTAYSTALVFHATTTLKVIAGTSTLVDSSVTSNTYTLTTGAITVGDNGTCPASASDSGNANWIEFTPFTVPAGTTSYTFSNMQVCTSTPAAATWGIALYSNNGGLPSTLLCSALSSTTPVNGYNSLTLASCPVLTAGQYWMGQITASNTQGQGWETTTACPNGVNSGFTTAALSTTAFPAMVTANLATTPQCYFETATLTPFNAPVFTLSGNVGVAGALVAMRGTSTTAHTTSDANGNYTFNTLGNDTYVVTPSLTGTSFLPATQTVTINGANAANVNFTKNAQVLPAWPLRISTTNRYFVDQNNKPFFIMGGSAWSMLCYLTPAQLNQYFADRSAHGFNAVMIEVVTDWYGGCGTTNGALPPSTGALADGVLPFTSGTNENTYVFSTPNSAYWTEVDNMVTAAANNGIVVALNPIDTGQVTTAGVFEPGCNVATSGTLTAAELAANGNTGMLNFGKFLGQRYSTSIHPNVIWNLGDDSATITPACTSGIHAVDSALVQNLMTGIKSGDANALITFETNNGFSYDTQYLNITPYVNINGTYGGPYDSFINAYNSNSSMPVVNVENNYTYENFAASTTGNGMTWPLTSSQFQNPCAPNSTPTAQVDPPCATMLNPAFDYITRYQDWNILTSGAIGGTFNGSEFEEAQGYNYGACTGCAGTSSLTWLTGGLDDTTSNQKIYFMNFLQGIQWWNLVPDTTHQVVKAGYGTYVTRTPGTTYTNLILSETYVSAAVTADHTLAVAYDPTGTTLTINLALFSGPVTLQWYDGTNGAYQPVTGSPFTNTGTTVVSTPGKNSRGISDWVLLMLVSSPAAALSTSSVAFGSQTQFIGSTPKTVTLTNTGGTALLINSVTLTGDTENICQPNCFLWSQSLANAAWFTDTNGTSATDNTDTAPDSTQTATTVTANIAMGDRYAGASGIVVPQNQYTVSGYFRVTSGTQPIEFVIDRNGTGGLDVETSPQFTVTTSWQRFSFTHSSVWTGASQAFGGFYIVNNSASVEVWGMQFESGSSPSAYVATTAPDFTYTLSPPPCTSIAPNANCIYTFTFTPTLLGSRTATFTLTDNAANSPQTVNLTGTGIGNTVTSGCSETLAAIDSAAVSKGSGRAVVACH